MKAINKLSIQTKSITEIFEKHNSIENGRLFHNAIDSDLTVVFAAETARVAVLGLDIYKYSHFPRNQQNLIPVVFKLLYDQTIQNLIEMELFFFDGYDSDVFWRQFIETGDGGFQILTTPLHCLIFSIYFHSNLRSYNAETNFFGVHRYVGDLEVRYSLTYNDVFGFTENYFGPAIIDNARIISGDSLNRFLIDKNTYQWSMKNLGGLETLTGLNSRDLLKLLAGQDVHDKPSLLFDIQEGSRLYNNITNAHVLKLDAISKKGKSFDIYGIYLQIAMSYGTRDHEDFTKYVISLGNLNTSGI